MGAISIIKERNELLAAVPDGATVPWDDLLKTAGDRRQQIESLAFGAPESVSRTGLDFTARAKAPAVLYRWGCTVRSDAVVNFTINNSGSELVVSKIAGVRVKPPIGSEFDLQHVTISGDAAGNFLVRTEVKFFGFRIPFQVRVDEQGKIVWF